MERREELYRLLDERGGFEVVRETVSTEQLRVIGRVDQNRFNFWLSVVHQLLTGSAARGSGWSCDISKQYMLAPDGVRQGWRVILQSQDLDAVAGGILAALEQTKPPVAPELESQLLPGYRDGQERGGVQPNGRGATSMFSAVTGPKAVLRVRNGGQ